MISKHPMRRDATFVRNLAPSRYHAARYHAARYHAAARSGLSIMEVLFAIGVLMIGLLGIASILPVAARNANSALQADATAAAIENQVSNAVARVREQLTHVDVPNQSLVAIRANPTPITNPFPRGHGPYSGLSIASRGYHVARGGGQIYTRIDLTAPPIVKSRVRAESSSTLPGLPAAGYRNLNFSGIVPAVLPGFPLVDNDWLFDPIDGTNQLQSAPLPRPSFCIDPAFLTAASNVRNDVGNPEARSLNGYDRSQFPCYDLNYNPQYSPGLQMEGAVSFPMTPRMYRVGLPTNALTLPANVAAKVMLSERDDLPLFRPEGELRGSPPGLLIRPTGATVGPTTSQRTGRYSTMITLVPTSMGGSSYEVSVVVFESRQLTINPLDDPTTPINDVFSLEPYTTSRWDDSTAAAATRTYGEEVLGIVEYAPGPITGGVGQFTYVHSAACNPEINVNDWVMLCRWIPDKAINKFTWYRVSDVLSEPTLSTSTPQLYRTSIEVRGPDWLFHPDQVKRFPTAAPVAAPVGSVQEFNYSPPGRGGNYLPPLSVNAYNRRCTTIVKMPSVVAVRTMNITF